MPRATSPLPRVPLLWLRTGFLAIAAAGLALCLVGKGKPLFAVGPGPLLLVSGLSAALLAGLLTRKRRRAEAELAATAGGIHALIERTPEPMAVWRRSVLVHANPALVRYLGYESVDELVGRGAEAFVHPEDLLRAVASARHLAETEQPVGPLELRLLRRDGSVVSAEIVGLCLILDGQRSLVGIARDLTERQQFTQRMMQMDRLLAVGTLAAGIAHEINNPLSFVIGNVDWLDRKLDEIRAAVAAATAGAPESARANLSAAGERLDRFREVLLEARAGAERVRVIVRDLRTLSRADDERRGAVDVERVADSAVQMVWNEIRHRAQLVKEYGGVPRVLANEGRMGQVLVSLLINAAQSIEEGHADGHSITVRTAEVDGRVAISITDSGAGLSDEALHRIFDPFSPTRPQGQGTGLGLSITQSIVQSMGGELLVESAPGRGSTFRVLLPKAPPGEPLHGATPLPLPPGRRGRVLVVDDEPLVGLTLRRTLEEEHEVVVTSRAREASERIAAGPPFDVILCDVMMPEMTGYELYEELSESAPAQARRMVFLTGGAFTPRAREFLARVENRRMEKPFDLERVRGLVRLMVREG